VTASVADGAAAPGCAQAPAASVTARRCDKLSPARNLPNNRRDFLKRVLTDSRGVNETSEHVCSAYCGIGDVCLS